MAPALLEFAKENWQWLWGAVLAPVALWIWNRYRTRPPMVSLDSYRLEAAYPHEGGLFVEIDLNFRVTNTSSRAVSRLAVQVASLDGHAEAREHDYRFGFAQFPRKSKNSSILLDSTLLPGLYRNEVIEFGMHLRSSGDDRGALLAEIESMLPPGIALRYRVVSERGPGKVKTTRLREVVGAEQFASQVVERLRSRR